MVKLACFIPFIEPRNTGEAVWKDAMHQNMEQFTRLQVWDLVPRPVNVIIVRTKQIYKNNTDKDGNVIRNKARLIAQGYSKIKGIYFDETFTHVTKIESICLLFDIACKLQIKHQMNVESESLNGVLQDKV